MKIVRRTPSEKIEKWQLIIYFKYSGLILRGLPRRHSRNPRVETSRGRLLAGIYIEIPDILLMQNSGMTSGDTPGLAPRLFILLAVHIKNPYSCDRWLRLSDRELYSKGKNICILYY